MIGRRLLRIRNRKYRWYHEVSYEKHGNDPKDVLFYRSDPQIGDLDPPAGSDEWLRIEMLHAPWNPADINTVQGRYPSPYDSSSMSSIASKHSRLDRKGLRVASARCIGRYFEEHPVIGSEGWGRITHSSLSSPSIPLGSLVTLGLPGLGTLRSSLWLPASAVVPVPNFVWDRLGPAGCSLFQLGGTALRLLSDFVVPEPGDVVLQNAGNSGVGFLASQLAASPSIFGKKGENGDENVNDEYPTPVMVSLIRRNGRSKQSFDEIVEYLTRVGKSALVLAEEDFFLSDDTDTRDSNNPGNLRKRIDMIAIREVQQRMRNLSANGSLPKLALNAVGGDSARLMLKLLEPNAGSTMVTYGGLSGNNVQLATPQLIFSDIRSVGYWHSRWMVRQHEQERTFRNQQTREETNASSRRAHMVDLLSKLVNEEDLKCPPAHLVRLENLREGLLWQSNQSDGKSSDPSRQSPIRQKLVWDCREYEKERKNPRVVRE